MSETTSPVPAPIDGEGVAEAYVVRELAQARAHLMRTRIVVIAGVAILGIYMMYLTNGFRENLEPKTAAVITTSLMNQRMDDAEPQFASFIREKVPETIRRAPDYALQRLPEYRVSIEERVEKDLRGHAETTSAQLSKELGTFLTTHRDQVEAMLTEPDKAAAAEEMGSALEAQFRTYLNEQPIAGDTIKSRLDKTLKAMDDIERRTSRLALNKGLSPTEQKTRRAIANLMRRIDTSKGNSAHQILQPDAVKNAVKRMGEGFLP